MTAHGSAQLGLAISWTIILVAIGFATCAVRMLLGV